MESKISEELTKLLMKTLWKLLMKRKIYRKLKESIRMTNTPKSETEKINLIEEGEKTWYW